MASLTFVMFHAFEDESETALDLIAFSVDSVSRVYPEAKIVLLTNRLTAAVPSGVSQVVVAVDSGKLMFERTRVYKEFIDGQPAAGHIVLMDTDMLLLRRIDELFDATADVTLTLRRWKLAPINGGLYILNMAAKAGVTSFFAALLATYEGLGADEFKWDGDQSALRDLLQPLPANIHFAVNTEWKGVKIRYVSCRAYNNTPSDRLLKKTSIKFRAKLLHFKGARKHAMSRYYGVYSDSRLGWLMRRF